MGHTEPVLCVPTAGFGFNGIVGSLGVAGAGEPLDVLLLGGSVHLWVRSRRGSRHGLPLDCFSEPWLPQAVVGRYRRPCASHQVQLGTRALSSTLLNCAGKQAA